MPTALAATAAASHRAIAASVCSTGLAARRYSLRTIPAVPPATAVTIPAAEVAATGEVAAMAVVEAAASRSPLFCSLFRAVLGLICSSLELLQRRPFPFASRPAVQYR